jgi:hypothetical protein
MRSLLVFALAIAFSAPAFAAGRGKPKQKTEDAPTPYSDQQDEEERDRRDLPDRSEATRERPHETDVEREDREISLSGQDDPNIGLSFEAIAGAMLLESSRGQGVQPQFMGGLRFTWEWSRTLLTDEFWREVFFLDLAWFATSDDATASWSDNIGTTSPDGVRDNAHFHYFTVAQAFAIPLGKTPLAVYAQGGLGFGYQTSTVMAQGMANTISAARFLVQYGAGLRFRIGMTSDDKLRLSFRIELTRFRRGYMDDTLVGGSLGLTF